MRFPVSSASLRIYTMTLLKTPKPQMSLSDIDNIDINSYATKSDFDSIIYDLIAMIVYL